MPVLLVVDDEPSILLAFRRAFDNPEVTLLTAETALQGVRLVEQQHPDAVILDIQLPDQSGLEAFDRIKEIDADVPVIFITGHAPTEQAIEATKRGAFDFLFKPLELNDLRRVVQNAFKIRRPQRVAVVIGKEEADPSLAAEVMVGRSPVMNEVYKAIGRAAPQDVTVLITGESGTGKELVARAIYHHSRRAQGPFLAINCAAIPETLLESELFGHEHGAFTGAERLRIGKFEQFSGGTLFLDEVGDMSPTTQTKVLRLLEEQRFERVGGNETIETDVRLIAATNHDLEQLVADRQFRKDLYYRLNVVTIALPPLRERRDDVPLLVKHFVNRFGRELNKETVEVAPETMELLQEYPWPGNVRELQSVIKQSLLRATGAMLLPEFLSEYVRNYAVNDLAQSDGKYDTARWDEFLQSRFDEGTENLYAESAALTDRHLLMKVLRYTRGSQLKAAKILGISRPTLRNKLRSVGIDVEQIDW